MITAPAYQGKTVGVFGLARTGIAAVHSLVASGATVWAWDDDAEKCAQVKNVAHNLYTADFSQLDALLLAPGVPLSYPKPHSLVEKAAQEQVPLISDVDVLQAARKSLPKHKIVAITGTNGKSTTTALIGHMVEKMSVPVAIGGNIGTGVLSLDPLEKGGVYVLELSSFQLDLTNSFKANVAILLNVSPDHLDRHGSFDNYVAAKTKLFDMQNYEKGIAVIGVDDSVGGKLIEHTQSQVIPVSVNEPVAGGVYVLDGILYDAMDGEAKRIGDLAEAKALQGSHNWQNAAAAYASGRQLKFSPSRIFTNLCSFPGLVHRQEIIATINGVSFVNDSKATNSAAALRALSAFENIHWIAGGKAKEMNFSHMSPAVANVKKAYFNGDAASIFERDLAVSVDSNVYADMTAAFNAACGAAVPGDTILLSPACTAFDQFKDFEERGECFRSLVEGYKTQEQTGVAS